MFSPAFSCLHLSSLTKCLLQATYETSDSLNSELIPIYNFEHSWHKAPNTVNLSCPLVYSYVTTHRRQQQLQKCYLMAHKPLTTIYTAHGQKRQQHHQKLKSSAAWILVEEPPNPSSYRIVKIFLRFHFIVSIIIMQQPLESSYYSTWTYRHKWNKCLLHCHNSVYLEDNLFWVNKNIQHFKNRNISHFAVYKCTTKPNYVTVIFNQCLCNFSLSKTTSSKSTTTSTTFIIPSYPPVNRFNIWPCQKHQQNLLFYALTFFVILGLSSRHFGQFAQHNSSPPLRLQNNSDTFINATIAQSHSNTLFSQCQGWVRIPLPKLVKNSPHNTSSRFLNIQSDTRLLKPLPILNLFIALAAWSANLEILLKR